MASFFVLCFCVMFAVAFWGENCQGQNGSVSIKVAYLRQIPELEKFCLNINTAKFNNKSGFLDFQKSIDVYDIESFVTRCVDLKLMQYIDHVMFILPENGGERCGKKDYCKASILVKSVIVMNGEKCFDVLKGDFFREANVFQPFRLSNMTPVGFTCSKAYVMHLLLKEERQSMPKDIFSPIEDLINNAVTQVSDMGQKVTSEIQEEVDVVGNTVTKEYSVLEQMVAANTADILEALENSTSALHVRLNFIAFQLNNEFDMWVGYFHIALRVLEVVGLCVLLGLFCKMYTKIRKVFSFFKWLGFRRQPKDKAAKNPST